MTASGAHVLRAMNRVAVLSALRDQPQAEVRIADLVTRTGLTRPTIAQAVEALVTQGLLEASTATSGGVGRPATRYLVPVGTRPVLGLDLGPHRVAVSLGDLAGRVLARQRHDVADTTSGDVLHALDEAVRATLDEAGIAAAAVQAATAGTPGVVDQRRGVVTFAPSVRGWTEIEVGRHLARLLPCPLTLENDANLAALAVSRTRPRPDDTVLYVQWGERLGAGLVIDGRIHRGASASAGEIGFIAGEGERTLLSRDGRGNLEARLGAASIAQQALSASARRPESSLARRLTEGGEPTSALFAAATDGDPTATALVAELADQFVDALAPVVLTLDPHALVIGGGVARAGAVLATAVQDRLDGLLLSTIDVELSPLAADAVLTGAVHASLERTWAALLDPATGAPETVPAP